MKLYKEDLLVNIFKLTDAILDTYCEWQIKDMTDFHYLWQSGTL